MSDLSVKIPTKKLASGFAMPVYGLGTWAMGGKGTPDTTNDQMDITAIKTAIDLGVTHIDTAEIYGAGHAEELVRQAIKGYDRNRLFIVSKVYYDHLGYSDLIRSAHQSLERLGTNYLDLYLLHRFNPNIPIEETMGALDALVADGLVKNIGVSNFTVERFNKAQAATKNKIVANQLHYNLKYREVEKAGLLKQCQENDVMLIAWRPLQKGLLTDEKIPIVQELVQKYGKTPAQIALNWLISQDHVVTLAKTSHVEHLKENLGAIGWQMEKEDIEKLRQHFPGQEDISDAVPLDYN